MKKLPVLLLVAALAACGGDDAPVAVDSDNGDVVNPPSDGGDAGGDTGGDTGDNGDAGDGGDSGNGDGSGELVTLDADIFMTAFCADSLPARGAPLAVAFLEGAAGTPAPTMFAGSACLGTPPVLSLTSGGFSSPTPAEALPHFGVTLSLSGSVLPLTPALDIMVNVGGPSGSDRVLSAASVTTVAAGAGPVLDAPLWQWQAAGVDTGTVAFVPESADGPAPDGTAVFRLCWQARLPDLSRDTCHVHALDDGRWLGVRIVDAPGEPGERVFVGWR